MIGRGSNRPGPSRGDRLLTAGTWLAGAVFVMAIGTYAVLGVRGEPFSDDKDVFRSRAPDHLPILAPAHPDLISSVSIVVAADESVVATLTVAGPSRDFASSGFDRLRWGLLPASGVRSHYEQDGYAGQSITYRAANRDAWASLLPTLGLAPDRNRSISTTLGHVRSRWAFVAALTGPPAIAREAAGELLNDPNPDLRHELRLTMPVAVEHHNAARTDGNTLIWETDPARNEAYIIMARESWDSVGTTKVQAGLVSLVAALVCVVLYIVQDWRRGQRRAWRDA